MDTDKIIEDLKAETKEAITSIINHINENNISHDAAISAMLSTIATYHPETDPLVEPILHQHIIRSVQARFLKEKSKWN